MALEFQILHHEFEEAQPDDQEGLSCQVSGEENVSLDEITFEEDDFGPVLAADDQVDLAEHEFIGAHKQRAEIVKGGGRVAPMSVDGRMSRICKLSWTELE